MQSYGLMTTAARERARLLTASAMALTVLCAGLLGPARPAAAATLTPISGEGSTWAYPAMRSWINDVKQTLMTVNYAPVGSRAGLSSFTQGAADWAQSELTYGIQDGATQVTPPARGYANVPDLAGSTAFVYNLSIGGQQVTNLRLSGAAIAGIFTNRITKWNDPLIAADNPGLALPATSITPVVRSDSAGETWQFTQWMNATDVASWGAYCAVIGTSPCNPVSAYPVQPGTNMISLPGDTGVSQYVAQPQSQDAIGYTTYSAALAAGSPMAKVLNAAGYYTAPTAGNVGVSLLKAQINTDQSSPLYLTQDLSQVYADTDPRTYELSWYSYLVVPTDLSSGMTTDKGFTLAAFGQFALCAGQAQLAQLGYAALPVNLVEAGYQQLANIPGASLPATVAAFIAGCGNPAFSPDGTDTLTTSDPLPPACDQQGLTQCGSVSPVSAIPVAVNVPQGGLFTLTVESGNTVVLTVNGSSNIATASTPVAVVSDTRNTYPGWSVSGQAGTLTGSGTAAGATMSGDQLGWMPTTSNIPLPPGVTLGPAIAPASPGLGTSPALLAADVAGVPNGSGTVFLGADLSLLIPPPQPAGNYTSSLAITAVTTNP
jgi:ABC-type phosphate transport system substrate-binding protein